jgi:EmrB/QacA subfamily drug resistance transporter
MRFGTAAARWVILATVLGSGIAAIDATVVGIAIPTIGRDLHASLGALQWVVTGYTLTLAAFLLLGGSLGDRFGRRKVYGVGVVWFVIASMACALAPNVDLLISMRVVQGVGAAMLTPGSLAILESAFDPRDRGRAIGAWSGLGGVATAAGPLLGGYLIAAASWRWIFLINAPLGAFVLFISIRHVPESKDDSAPPGIDATGAGLATLSLGGLTYALIDGPNGQWGHPIIIGMLVVGVASAIAFVTVERRSTHPMLPMGVFGIAQFTVTNIVTLIVYAALGGALFLLPVQLQVVDHYSPLEAGASLLPITVIMLLLSAPSGRLATRIGPRLQMCTGPVLVGAGLVLLGRVASDHSYVSGVLPAVVVFGLGLATTVAPLTATALAALPVQNAGLASAVNNDVARIGSLLAVAILPATSGISGSAYLNPTKLSSGFRTATLLAGILCVIGGLIAGLGIRNPARAVRHETSDVTQCHHCALDAAPWASSSTAAQAQVAGG